jgi:hypothetical protein
MFYTVVWTVSITRRNLVRICGMSHRKCSISSFNTTLSRPDPEGALLFINNG